MSKVPADDPQHSLLSVERIAISFEPGQLLRGRLVAKATIFGPRFHFISTRAAAPTPGAEAVPPDPAAALASAFPFGIDRMEVRKGEMTLVFSDIENHPELRITDIEATVENVQTFSRVASQKPTVLAARARLGNTGELFLFYTANLLAKDLTLSGQARIERFSVTDLNPILSSQTGLVFEKGQFSAYTAFSTRAGQITGGVKPFLKRAEVRAISGGLLAWLKEKVVDSVIGLFSDRVPGREAVATVVAFQGEIMSPRPEAFTAVLTLVRNAFVEGLVESFRNLPLTAAMSPQVRDTLSMDQERLSRVPTAANESAQESP